MKLLRITVILFLLGIVTWNKALAQFQTAEALDINDTIPGSLWNSIKSKISDTNDSDAVPKLVILDFWSTTCTHCISAFPEMEAIQKYFKGEVAFFLINSVEDDAQVSKRFASFGERNKSFKVPSFPTINGDTVLKRLFPHRTEPHHVWIDDQGIVRAITSGFNTTKSNIQSFLNSKEVNVKRKSEILDFDYNKSLLIEGGGRNLDHLMNYSLFMNHIEGVKSRLMTHLNRNDQVRYNEIRAVNYPILSLYKVSYGRSDMILGNNPFRYNNRVVFDLLDTTRLIPPIEKSLLDDWNSDNTYCYELRVSTGGEKEVYDIMQQDLQRAFGYRAKIEKRKVQCLALVIIDSLRMTSFLETGSPEGTRMLGSVLTFEKEPIGRLTSYLKNIFSKSPLPVIDMTGYKGNISLSLDTTAKTLGKVNDLLQKYGLTLRPENAMIDMLIIYDE